MTDAMPPSWGFYNSGLSTALKASGRKTLLVVTNEPRMRKALYQGLSMGGGISGVWIPISDIDLSTVTFPALPAEITSSTTSNCYVRESSSLDWSVGDQTNRRYIFDTSSHALSLRSWHDGSVGDPVTEVSAHRCPGAFREFMWDGSTPPADTAELIRIALGSVTPGGNTTWYQDELDATLAWVIPAANGSGVNFINGGPSITPSSWRGNNSPSFSANGNIRDQDTIDHYAIVISAGSGAPRVAFNHQADDSFANMGARMAALGVFLRSRTQVNGIDLIVVDVPTLHYYDLGNYANSTSPFSGGGFGLDNLESFLDAIGVTSVDAILVDVFSVWPGGFTCDSIQDDTSEPRRAPVAWNDKTTVIEFLTYIVNVGQNLRGAAGDDEGAIPVCYFTSHFYGQMSNAEGSVTPSFQIASDYYRGISYWVHWMTTFRDMGAYEGLKNASVLNCYEYVGSDGPSSPTTQNYILAGDVIEVGLSAPSKIKGQYSTSVNYAAGDGVYDLTDGADLGANTRWFKCTNANGPGTAVKATSDTGFWTPLNFRPKSALCDDKVELFVQQITTPEGGPPSANPISKGMVRPNASCTGSPLSLSPWRPNR